MSKTLDQITIDALRTRLNIAIDHENITVDWLLNFITELKAENKKLQEQLQNTIIPKFKSQDIAYRIHWFTKEIEQVIIVNTKIEIVVNMEITYTIAILGENESLDNLSRNFFEDINSYIDQVRESDLFATKEEAEKHLIDIRCK